MIWCARIRATRWLHPGYGIDLPDGQISTDPAIGYVQPDLQKYFCFSESESLL
jgi:hypothetical protein